jgi:hypothetical protein
LKILASIVLLLATSPANATPLPTGYPDRSEKFDALPGFKNPPPGYGQVPFWWWSGDALNEERLLWQVRELHKKGISGVQVNYSHTDAGGWPTDLAQPKIFSEEWWKYYRSVSEECAKLDMGIGLSTYTLDWPNGGENLFKKLFYDNSDLNALELIANKHNLNPGETKTLPCTEGTFAAWAYRVKDGVTQPGGTDLTALINNGRLTWTAPSDSAQWQVWTYGSKKHPGTLNPLLENSGNTVIQGFYQQFQDHNDGTSKGLNYFFNDELQVGLGKFAWNTDFPAEFEKRKGYSLFDVLPGMWEDMGDSTPKTRIDYADVRMALMEERYFEPIYNWHTDRGIIYGCDNHGRGLDPHAYGDYFRATRWYSAPGHDTPGGNADVIKGKVSSSIAKLYQRPRVWLEGYHSLGWGATPENLMFATRENYLLGCTLLNLHGLYYSTYGSRWEWAPPCYHFRMPYWAHMGTFLKYFDRLSFLMSQGDAVADVAIIYPVTPYEAELKGKKATSAAFDLGQHLMAAGINFDFIDHQSIDRAEIKDGALFVKNANASYKALVFPDMEAARWSNLEKAAAFTKAGGLVISTGQLPEATERAGRNDPQLAPLLDQAIPAKNRLGDAKQALTKIKSALVQDSRGINGTVRTLHRKIGPRDVYLTMDAKPGDVVEFRAKGAVELWDPWTGNTSPLRVIKETATGTQVELPLEKYEAQIVVFDPAKKHTNPTSPLTPLEPVKTLPDTDWQVAFLPTMDNQWGDFRLPVTESNKLIRLEARRFEWLNDNSKTPPAQSREWKSQLGGYGPLLLLHKAAQPFAPEKEAELSSRATPPTDGWNPYEFSWRHGVEDNPGHQGWHGNKAKISDHFLRVGTVKSGNNSIKTLTPEEGVSTYYFWTQAITQEACQAELHLSKATASNAGYIPSPPRNANPVITPSAVYLNCEKILDPSALLPLKAGANTLLIRMDGHGEGHAVLRRIGFKESTPPTPLPLSMTWHQWLRDGSLVPFSPIGTTKDSQQVAWFRFTSAPGTTTIMIPEALSTQPVLAFYNGTPMTPKGDGRFEAQQPASTAPVIDLRLMPPAGFQGGSALPEPIVIETNGAGTMPLGDWSAFGILNNYSGGVTYSKSFTLTPEEAARITDLDLGKVVATAEVNINGMDAGIRVAPPWKFDVSGLLQAGENKISVTVYNTLSNHYQTEPNYYRGKPDSGLYGPVRLLGKP